MILDKTKQKLLKFKYKGNVKIGRGVILNSQNEFNGQNTLADCCTIKYCNIGYGSYVGHDSYLSWAKIGKYCSIAPYTNTVIGKHPLKYVSTHPAFYSVHNFAGFSFAEENSYADLQWLDNGKLVSIGNDVWVGQNVMICDGVKIGHGAVVAAGSFVNRDVAPYTVVGGTPAKWISNRFAEDDILFLLKLEWWNLPPISIKMLSPYFNSIEVLKKYISKLSQEVTVIIPYYNKKDYVEICIESIENQILKPASIVVVDDCSPDCPNELFAKLSSKYSNLRYIRLEKNGGVSHARNIGIRESNTKYITFVDADDYYYDSYKLLNEMLLIKHNEKQNRDVISYSKTMQVDINGKEIIRNDNEKDYLNGNAYLQILSTWKSETIPRDYLIKKEILELVGGYNENRTLYEDLELLLKISKTFPLAFTYSYGTAYRQVDGGLSSAAKEKHREALADIRSKAKEELTSREKFKCFFWKCCAKIRRELQSIISQ